ncbi:MAG: hypothetical protein WA421_09765 [Nitrososphaeraceae archaeon]
MLARVIKFVLQVIANTVSKIHNSSQNTYTGGYTFDGLLKVSVVTNDSRSNGYANLLS